MCGFCVKRVEMRRAELSREEASRAEKRRVELNRDEQSLPQNHANAKYATIAQGVAHFLEICPSAHFSYSAKNKPYIFNFVPP